MSTRCNVIIKDKFDELIFYRHSDGYPECTKPSLERFLKLVIDGTIRDNLGQAAGWLILLGAVEYQVMLPEWFPQAHVKAYNRDYKKTNIVLDELKPSDWQCGAYEPTTAIHGDIQYLYVVDLETNTIHIDGEDDYKYTGIFSDDNE